MVKMTQGQGFLRVLQVTVFHQFLIIIFLENVILARIRLIQFAQRFSVYALTVHFNGKGHPATGRGGTRGSG